MLLGAFALISIEAAQAASPITFYGELDISVDFVRGGDTEWVSNVSKLGLRGQHVFDSGLVALYQLEQEIDPIHGGLERRTLLSMRNSFIGIEHEDFGRLLFGTHDSPLKKAQGRVDQFNDQLGDIKALLVGEVRSRDSIIYRSPRIAEQVHLSISYVPADGDFSNSHSISVSHETDDLYWSLAMDTNMRKNDRITNRTSVYDSYRVATQFSVNSWQLGVLAQTSRLNGSGKRANWAYGYVVSAARPLGKVKLQAQYGISDIISRGASQALVELSTKLADRLRIYGIVSRFDSGTRSANQVDIGVEYKFSLDVTRD